MIASYIANTRETTAHAINNSLFPAALLESVCVCKFVGTSFGVDVVSVLRKMMVREGGTSSLDFVFSQHQYVCMSLNLSILSSLLFGCM